MRRSESAPNHSSYVRVPVPGGTGPGEAFRNGNMTAQFKDFAGVSPRRGRLVIVGTGITAVSQMTLETIGYIQRADIVFYHATNGVTATQIRELNANAVDLYEYYGEGKKRRITYVEMAELMLREVRRGSTVVGVFHGHPGYFVRPARRALAIASLEGYETALLAAVSAPDCMFSDLRVDPGVFGCQILMASRLLQEDAIVATTGHVVFLQVAAVGDSGFSFSGYKNATLAPFFEKLIELYGEHQEAVYYTAAIFPGFEPVIMVYKLLDFRDSRARESIGSGLLYLPPRGVTVSSLQSVQSFTAGNPYGAFESKVVEELDRHQTPPEYKLRRASAPLYRAMAELGTIAKARELYLRSPSEFASRFPDLNANERHALESRDVAKVRAVSTVQEES
jgi:Tetrapyrrole (Corrin/Porphyrin) Methylases